MILRGCLLVHLFTIAYLSPTTSPNTTETNVERSYLRTEAIIEQRTEEGRMVLLVCRRKRNCQRARSTIPQWVRDFNEEKDYSGSEIIHYHFYIMGPPLPIMNSSITYPSPTLVYIIAETPHFFTGDVTNRIAVSTWLQELDSINMIKPKGFQELDKLISMADEQGNCTSKYLVLINNEKECPYETWPVVARFASMQHGILPVYIPLPLEAESSVVIFKRLPLLVEGHCRHLFLMYQDSYSLPLEVYSPLEVSETISELFPASDFEGDSCSALLEAFWFPTRMPLTELQLIFFSGEHDLLALEHNLSYIVIGIAGGCAVCTLAFSIFWGLNGSAFAK